MLRRLTETVAELGRHTAGDATRLSARRQRSKRPGGYLPVPTGGQKEYTDEEGNVTKVIEWFGYKLHLVVDVRHEVALAYRISGANRGDNELLGDLVAQARRNVGDGPEQEPAVSRIDTLPCDRAADTEQVHQELNTCRIKPVVEMRSLWKGRQDQTLPGHGGESNVAYGNGGTAHPQGL